MQEKGALAKAQRTEAGVPGSATKELGAQPKIKGKPSVAREAEPEEEERMPALIDKWIQKQDFFEDDFVVKPACIHVVKDGQVFRVNLYTRKYEAPEVRRGSQAMVVRTAEIEEAERTTAKRREELKKVKDEKAALRKQLEELEKHEKTLAETVEGRSVYDELQSKRSQRRSEGRWGSAGTGERRRRRS